MTQQLHSRRFAGQHAQRATTRQRNYAAKCKNARVVAATRDLRQARPTACVAARQGTCCGRGWHLAISASLSSVCARLQTTALVERYGSRACSAGKTHRRSGGAWRGRGKLRGLAWQAQTTAPAIPAPWRLRPWLQQGPMAGISKSLTVLLTESHGTGVFVRPTARRRVQCNCPFLKHLCLACLAYHRARAYLLACPLPPNFLPQAEAPLPQLPAT
jgi:hypothetical protein